MSDTWFKFHNRARHSRKMNAIADKHFRNYIMLSTLASENRGKITKALDVLAFELHRKPGQVRESLQVLISIGLIEDVGDFYRPARWGEMQLNPTGSTQRMQAWRERHRALRSDGKSDGARDAPVTTEAEAEAEAEADKKETESSLRSDSSKKAPKPRAQIGAFQPSPEAEEKAVAFWASKDRGDIDLTDQLAQFRDHHLKLASTMADWPAAWRTWYRETVNRSRKPNVRKSATANAIAGAAMLYRQWEAEEHHGASDAPKPALPAPHNGTKPVQTRA